MPLSSSFTDSDDQDIRVDGLPDLVSPTTELENIPFARISKPVIKSPSAASLLLTPSQTSPSIVADDDQDGWSIPRKRRGRSSKDKLEERLRGAKGKNLNEKFARMQQRMTKLAHEIDLSTPHHLHHAYAPKPRTTPSSSSLSPSPSPLRRSGSTPLVEQTPSRKNIGVGFLTLREQRREREEGGTRKRRYAADACEVDNVGTSTPALTNSPMPSPLKRLLRQDLSLNDTENVEASGLDSDISDEISGIAKVKTPSVVTTTRPRLPSDHDSNPFVSIHSFHNGDDRVDDTYVPWSTPFRRHRLLPQDDDDSDNTFWPPPLPSAMAAQNLPLARVLEMGMPNLFSEARGLKGRHDKPEADAADGSMGGLKAGLPNPFATPRTVWAKEREAKFGGAKMDLPDPFATLKRVRRKEGVAVSVSGLELPNPFATPRRARRKEEEEKEEEEKEEEEEEEVSMDAERELPNPFATPKRVTEEESKIVTDLCVGRTNVERCLQDEEVEEPNIYSRQLMQYSIDSESETGRGDTQSACRAWMTLRT